MTQQIDDMTKKINHFNMNRISVKNDKLNESHQRKIDNISELNTQANINMQNEKLKSFIFSDK